MPFIKSHNISTFLLIAAILLAVFIGFSLVKAVAPAGYPVSNLDNCKNKEECREVCLSTYPTQCVYYHPELTTELLLEIKEVLNEAAEAFAQEGGPNGCSTDEECIGYCSNEANRSECYAYYVGPLWYWSNENITDRAPLWNKIISAIITAMEKNIEPPAECRSTYYNDHLSCVTQCAGSIDPDGNPVERSESCINYLSETGYFSKNDFKLEAKLKELARRGETGGCSEEETSAEEALSYCFDIGGFYPPCAGSEDPVACFALADKYDLIPEEDIELGKIVAPFLKNGQAPGKCRNLRECRNYCSIQANYDECTEFGNKLGLIEEPDDPNVRDVIVAIGKGEGPGQCKDEVSCRKYCENIDNIQECLVFVERFNLATPDELKEMRQIAAARRAGVPFPGNCKTKQSCLQYCEVPSHTVECVNFAEAAGFISGDEAAQARKFAPLVARGETPGGCTRKAQCEAYCEDTTHIDECLDFAIKYDVLPPDELEIVKKIQPFVKAGKMPGGCKTKAQCEAYCENGDHVTECIDIGLALGIIKPEEVEMIKKSGGRGPGNCRSREACEAFCSDPKNQKECIDFAVRIGLITEEEAQGYQNAGDMNQCFEEADEKIIACFVTNLGADVFEQMKSGRMPHDIAILEKMRKAKACVSQYSDQATDVLEEFLEALPAANSCVATEFGPDFIGRLRKGNVPCSQMKGIKEKMNACFTEGTNALFEPCAQKECDQVQSCMTDVGKSLADIAKQVDAGTPAKPQKQELPPVLQDKLNSCGINLDPLACVSKSTCKEFFLCLGPSGSETDSASSGETPPELLERMNSCQQELDEIKMRECTDKPTCSEVTACLEAQQSGDTQTTGTTGEKVELPADIQSRLTACQQEENQAKIDACLALSCSEFDACIKTLQQAGGDQGQAEQGSEDPRVGAKIQACQEEKVNACLAMPCSEFFACLNSLGAGGGDGGGSPNPAIEAKVQSCTPQSEGQ